MHSQKLTFAISTEFTLNSEIMKQILKQRINGKERKMSGIDLGVSTQRGCVCSGGVWGCLPTGGVQEGIPPPGPSGRDAPPAHEQNDRQM